MYSIHVIQGFDQGTRHEFTGNKYGLGRDSDNHLKLHDSEVSRFHAEFRIREDEVTLVDLESSNGTYLNGQRIASARVANGDRIQIGKTHIIFHGGVVAVNSDLSAEIQFADQTDVESQIIQSVVSDVPISDAQPADTASDVQSAHSYLQVMYQTAEAVSQTLDIDQLLQRVLNLIFEWVEADRGCIILLDPRDGELTPKARRDRSDSEDSQKMIISRRILDYVMEKGEGVISTNAGGDDRWEATASIVSSEVNEAICVPLTGRYGIVGVIYIDTSLPEGEPVLVGKARRFSDEHLKMMIAIGHQAALAIEDTYYHRAMVQSEKLVAIGETVTTIAHHIKNILQGIQGGGYLVDDGLHHENQQTIEKGWGIVRRNQARISELVMDMLNYSKDRSPELSLGYLQTIAEDVVEMLQSLARVQTVSLTLETEQGVAENWFDREGIHRALLNVITNAIEACGEQENAEVTISIGTRGNAQVVRVIDNGPGISADHIPQLFTAFVSGKGSQGTGLGLAVSRKIMREHGGDLTLESPAGQGAEFHFILPIHSEKVSESELGDSLATGLSPPNEQIN
ncbi:MAG: ATP-binding protein [Planctomycetota bacterium]|nr:ATP-binding protein [Planctomycetota bacterium]